MKNIVFNKEEFKKEVRNQVKVLYRRNIEEATPAQVYQAVAYAVKDDIIDLVKKMSFNTSSFYTKKDDGAYLLDSQGLIQQQLLNLGIKQEHITVSPYCTYENEDLFFSYRRNKSPHRHITCIRLK